MTTILCHTSCGVVVMLAPKYELDISTQSRVVALCVGIRYVMVTLTVDISILRSCHVMPLRCSTSVPSLNWI